MHACMRTNSNRVVGIDRGEGNHHMQSGMKANNNALCCVCGVSVVRVQPQHIVVKGVRGVWGVCDTLVGATHTKVIVVGRRWQREQNKK